MGDHGHEDGPIHQAGWVMWMTLAVCFTFAAVVLGIGALT